ncbi:MAG: YcxB family protein [Bacilli bacterium]
MRLKYNLTEEMYLEHLLLFNRNSEGMQQQVKRGRLYTLLYEIGIIVITYFLLPLKFWIPIAIVIALFSIYQFVNYEKTMEERYVESLMILTEDIHEQFGTVKLSVRENEIIQSNRAATVAIRYSSIHTMDYTDENLHLFTNTAYGIVIPRKGISPRDFEKLEDIVVSKLKMAAENEGVELYES